MINNFTVHFIVVEILNDNIDGIDDGVFSKFVGPPRVLNDFEDWSLFWHALSELLKRCHRILILFLDLLTFWIKAIRPGIQI